MTDAGLALLRGCRGLTHLDLGGTEVTDAGLAPFKECKELTWLGLQKTKVTAAKVEELRKALPACKIEWDGGIVGPARDAERAAAEYVLSLGGEVAVYGGNRDLSAVADLPRNPFRLIGVRLAGKKVDDAGLASLKDCTGLTHFDLSECTQVTDAGLAPFKDWKNLTHLWLGGTPRATRAWHLSRAARI